MSERGVGSRRVRVLVVDDSVPCRRAAAAVVRVSDGFELSGTARSGAEAVRLAEALRPDLVLLDVRMREMSGIDAAQLILEQRPETVVVLVSAWAEETASERVARCGAAAALPKHDLKPRVLDELWARHGHALTA